MNFWEFFRLGEIQKGGQGREQFRYWPAGWAALQTVSADAFGQTFHCTYLSQWHWNNICLMKCSNGEDWIQCNSISVVFFFLDRTTWPFLTLPTSIWIASMPVTFIWSSTFMVHSFINLDSLYWNKRLDKCHGRYLFSAHGCWKVAATRSTGSACFFLAATIVDGCCLTNGVRRRPSVRCPSVRPSVRRRRRSLWRPFRHFPFGLRLCNHSMLLLSTKACRMTFFWRQRSKVTVARAKNVKIASCTLSQKVLNRSSCELVYIIYRSWDDTD